MFMTITKRTVAEKIASYLQHDIAFEELVSWAKDAMMDGEFEENDTATITDGSGFWHNKLINLGF